MRYFLLQKRYSKENIMNNIRHNVKPLCLSLTATQPNEPELF